MRLMGVIWSVSERKMARMKISRRGTTALKSSWGSYWRFWIKGSGRMTSAPCWRRWERRSTLTWTLPRSSLTRPVGITGHTSPLPMVRKYMNQCSYIAFLLPSWKYTFVGMCKVRKPQTVAKFFIRFFWTAILHIFFPQSNNFSLVRFTHNIIHQSFSFLIVRYIFNYLQGWNQVCFFIFYTYL